MGVYIPGMEMPTNRSTWIVIYPDGDVVYSDKTDEWEMLDKKAVPVPPHGRLGDLDALVNKHFGHEYLSKAMTATREEMGVALTNIPLVINNAPTIIPADEGGGG